LFTTQPGFGHLNPFLPYAVALREAGHEVRFATAPVFADVQRALDNPALRANARALRAECDAMDPISEAVGVLERVADGARADD
jgi:UDP:flavonoid glycosyltransferase YjiC (YdhE family)